MIVAPRGKVELLQDESQSVTRHVHPYGFWLFRSARTPKTRPPRAASVRWAQLAQMSITQAAQPGRPHALPPPGFAQRPT